MVVQPVISESQCAEDGSSTAVLRRCLKNKNKNKKQKYYLLLRFRSTEDAVLNLSVLPRCSMHQLTTSP
jgi:hypothetical protein